MAMDSSTIRAQFPALSSGAVFFDNPGGTQVPSQVVERMVDHLVTKNANHGGAFRTSRESDAVLDEARQAVADFLNAARPEEIVFGPNMTTLTFGLSRALARELEAGDEIIVTRLDHDANIAPWLLVAEDRGCRVHWVDFDVEDCTLRLEQLEAALTSRTRLVAVGYASNAVGTINPVARIIEMAHQRGALCFVDAVQYAAHGPIDVQELDCDYLAVSAYKFFGPHLACLYGKYEHLNRLRAHNVRPAPDDPPGKFETGTGNHEGIAGTLGALEYLSWLGKNVRRRARRGLCPIVRGQAVAAQAGDGRHPRLRDGTLAGAPRNIERNPGLRIYGLTDPKMLDRRVPTVSFTLEGWAPRAVAEALDAAGIYVWDGNYYALAVTERLGLESSGGMVRVGLVHYNTVDEVARLGEVLRSLTR